MPLEPTAGTWNYTVLRKWSDALRSVGYDVYADLSLTGINVTMFTTGTHGGQDVAELLADFAVKAGLSALITDYEPADGGPTDVYPQWLGVVGDKLRAKGVKIGAHVAAWGGDCYPTSTCPSVLHRYDAFAKAKVDIFASMDYGLNWHNSTDEVSYLEEMIRAVGGDMSRIAPGVGSMLNFSAPCLVELTCDNFCWTPKSFGKFVDKAISLGVEEIGVWPAHIDGWGTMGPAPWFLDILRCFLAGQDSSCTPTDVSTLELKSVCLKSDDDRAVSSLMSL